MKNEKLKRIIVKIKVNDDIYFLGRICSNAWKTYNNYIKKGNYFDDEIYVYSLNFVYGKIGVNQSHEKQEKKYSK